MLYIYIYIYIYKKQVDRVEKRKLVCFSRKASRLENTYAIDRGSNVCCCFFK